KSTEARGELILQGIGVSPGVAIGEVVVFAQEGVSVPERSIDPDDIPREIARFEEALMKTRHQIAEIQHRVEAVLGNEHASIFDAHLLVVDDRYFVEEVIRTLHKEQINVERITRNVADRYIDRLSQVEDDYLRERAADVRDVTRRIVRNLAGEVIDRMDQIERPCIVVAHDFSPSDTAGMNRNIVHAFVADVGSPTSHTAIMARALEVPAVVGLHNISQQVVSGDTLLVDGAKGVVIVRPSSECLLSYARKAEDQKTILCELETLKDKPSETKDGFYVPIAANIELPAEIKSINRHGAKGVGLFRTEFLFLNEDQLPDEEDQLAVYRDVADYCAPDNVVIRTLDLGGDKFTSTIKITPEINPFLGWRAIRFCLANPDFFKQQLRAILRAGADRNVSIMYPMISGAGEIKQANRILEECRGELEQEGIPYAKEMRIGAMIEVPSAALTAEQIAPYVDFFSIGTNDLIQYTLAVDRVNENVAHLYQPTHSAILRLIRTVVEAGHAHRIPTTVCGQMAASPDLVPLLIGLGVDELSISPPSVPLVKDVIRNLHYSECLELAEEALRTDSASKILRRCRELLAKRSPEILELIS
ncbi:MAG: phosphoenolpyruvate--protein phosphotransferase, partial [Kiritimatiellaeota bacterium]|nr:phosphoenolpyruvate--protein phosphotransferase [Kiritimatiellota bacterium]